MFSSFIRFFGIAICLLAAALSAWPMAADSTQTPATLAGPLTFGSPDQPYGKRRPVTDADRAAIRSYRSGRSQPIYSTAFTDLAELQKNWASVEDDSSGLLSCRRTANAVASKDGLRLETRLATDCHNKWSTANLVSKAKYSYGYFETALKIADINGMNNAFWVTSDDSYELDPSEIHYPNIDGIGLHFWPPKGSAEKHTSMGYRAFLNQDLSAGFHVYGFLWTPTDLIFAVDGEAIAAIATGGRIKGPITLRYSSALANWAGKVPEHPEGHNMYVRSLRVFSYEGGH